MKFNIAQQCVFCRFLQKMNRNFFSLKLNLLKKFVNIKIKIGRICTYSEETSEAIILQEHISDSYSHSLKSTYTNKILSIHNCYDTSLHNRASFCRSANPRIRFARKKILKISTLMPVTHYKSTLVKFYLNWSTMESLRYHWEQIELD